MNKKKITKYVFIALICVIMMIVVAFLTAYCQHFAEMEDDDFLIFGGMLFLVISQATMWIFILGICGVILVFGEDKDEQKASKKEKIE